MPSTFFTASPQWRWLIVAYFFLGGLAAGSYFRRWTWLYIVDLVVLGLVGCFGTLGAVASLARPHAESVTARDYFSLASDLVALGIAIWMVVALVQQGPWGLRKAPAPLET